MPKLPSLSKFKKGQKVLMGTPAFGIYGIITKIVPKDTKQIKIDTNMGVEFSVSLEDFGKTWGLADK
jgi:preprotein translocase subunit YajC